VKGAVRAWLLAALAILVGCARPLPPDRLDYVGEWRAPDMALVITQGGRVAYQRRQGASKVSVHAPLQRFEGASFVVGIGPFRTHFEVGAAPHQEGATWKMTIDGVELTRVAGPEPGRESGWRSGGNQKVRS